MRQWRSRRDSNPRNGYPFTHLAGERLRPLGHGSTAAFRWRNAKVQAKSYAN